MLPEAHFQRLLLLLGAALNAPHIRRTIARAALAAGHRLATDVAPAARIVRAAELAAYREAEQAIDAARAQADEIVAGTQAAFEAERRRGHAEGTECARREGTERMAEQVARTDG